MQARILALVLSLSSSALAATGGADRPFPLDLSAYDDSLGGLRYTNAPARVQELAQLDEVAFAGVMLPDGSLVDLELARIRPERMRFRYHVDGLEVPGVLTGLDLSIWKGHVRGIAGSDVMLSFSQLGAQGWIDTGTELVHVMGQPDASGIWWNADTVLVSDGELVARGHRLDGVCGAQRPAREALELGPAGSAGGGNPPMLMGPGCSLRECKVSLESDFQYFQKFNDVGAQAVYTTTLWAFISDRYETQASTILTFPYVGFYTTSNDPWTTPDAPGTSNAMLTEFRNAWVGNVPNGGHVGHFMSGAALGGGVAWLDVLCNSTFNFAVAGNINSNVNFPVVVSPTNWDFIVCAHELGHNFDAPHTHEYCPPLDQCAPSGYFGPCQSQQVCTNQGTVMSYCHLCAGGTSNITTFFHTVSAQAMTAAAQSCLPQYSGMTGSSPALVVPGATTPVTAMIAGTPVGPVQLLWRPTPSTPFTATNMSSTGNGNYAAALPAFGCSESPQFYYAFTEATCGLVTFPAGAPSSLIQPEVGSLQTVFLDDFQTNLGWTPTNLGATSGDWQRGVPVNDPNWDYDPATDGDGSGACWLTQNQLGNTDVDGGAVRLMSPQLDLSGGDVLVEYVYYLRLTVADTVDRLLVEISANGTNGPWVEIARHTQNGSAWRPHSITGASIAASGVTLGNDMRVRFTANDSGTASIVESGLDGFRVSRVLCTGVGASFCTSYPNSSGSRAVASAAGSTSIAANDLVLQAAPLPASSNGLFFFGSTATQVPFGNGIRCVAAPSQRLPLGVVSSGVLTSSVDNTAPPAAPHLAPGSTWNFQAWFRDAPAGGSNYNLSDGYRITFTP
jgi:hypothetical protein